MTEPTHGDTIRQALEENIEDGFRDDDGVWHDGPHLREALAALDALEAENRLLREELRLREESQIPVIPRGVQKKIDALETNLRAATDLVQRAEKLIPGFASTWTPVILSDAAEVRARADALEAERDEWKELAQKKAFRAVAAENRADDLANQLQDAESLLGQTQELLYQFGGGDDGRGSLYQKINEFLTRRL